MISSQTLPANPSLSSQFDRARLLSRILFVLLSIGFFVTLAVLVCMPVLVMWPGAGDFQSGVGDFHIAANLSIARRAYVGVAFMLDLVPVILLLHHGRNLFRGFAKGEVFTVVSIAHIRAAGLWLMILFAAEFFSQLLFTASVGLKPSAHNGGFSLILIGLVTYVAAYVMAEARRIADDNASIL